MSAQHQLMFLLATIQNGGSVLGLFSNNLINWFALVGLLVWLWRKYVPTTLSQRKNSIEYALQNAASAKQEGEAFLAEQRQKLAQAETESDKIVSEAKKVAQEMHREIAEQTKKELADFTARIDHDIAIQRQMAITELRAQAAKAAIALSKKSLPQALTEACQNKLLDQFVSELDSIN